MESIRTYAPQELEDMQQQIVEREADVVKEERECIQKKNKAQSTYEDDSNTGNNKHKAKCSRTKYTAKASAEKKRDQAVKPLMLEIISTQRSIIGELTSRLQASQSGFGFGTDNSTPPGTGMPPPPPPPEHADVIFGGNASTIFGMPPPPPPPLDHADDNASTLFV
jgi:hypothetical protein